MADPARSSPEDELLAIDRLCGLLECWTGQAGRYEQSACQTRIGIIFGMAMFLTSGATVFAYFELDGLALIFASAAAAIAAYLNHIYEVETKAWHEALKILTRIQYNVINEARCGRVDIDLRNVIAAECGYGGSNLPTTITMFDIAGWMRESLLYRNMDTGSKVLYGTIAAAAVVLFLYSWHAGDHHPAAAYEPLPSSVSPVNDN